MGSNIEVVEMTSNIPVERLFWGQTSTFINEYWKALPEYKGVSNVYLLTDVDVETLKEPSYYRDIIRKENYGMEEEDVDELVKKIPDNYLKFIETPIKEYKDYLKSLS